MWSIRPTARVRPRTTTQYVQHQNWIGRRQFSNSPRQRSQTDPKAIAEAFLAKFAAGQSFTRKQLLDANQLRLFSLTLNRHQLWASDPASRSLENSEPAQGTPLPPGYHLAYFTPAQLPTILGVDGTDASFNPNPPFTRRMWAGGKVSWPGADAANQSYLKVGDEATETTRVLSCEAKTIKKTGESMLVVGVEKEFRNAQDEVCVLDQRNWVFRTELDPGQPGAKIPAKKPELSEEELNVLSEGSLVRTFNRDVVILFRFSALTFNGHRIHYDLPWARDVEGHRNVVVHGPMNLVSMLDMWRDEVGSANKKDDVVYPREIEYRATSPVYAGEGYRILMNQDAAEKFEGDMRVVSNDGTLCMKGTIHG